MRSHCCWNRIHTHWCNVDRRHEVQSKMACTRVYVYCRDHRQHMSSSVGQSNGVEVLRVLCVLSLPTVEGREIYGLCVDLAGASYSGQATTFAYVQFRFHGARDADSLYYSWANQICADDDQERAIVLASMKYVFHALFPVIGL